MAARLEAMSDAKHALIGGASGLGLSQYTGLTQTSKAGPVWTGKVAIVDDYALTAPMRRKKPTTYFVNSMGDLFHESVTDEMIDKIFAVMALCPQHVFQILTKRAARMRAYFEGPWQGVNPIWARVADATFEFAPQGKLPSNFHGTERAIGPNGIPEFGWRRFLNIGPLPNVWLGVSCEDQERADERIPDLLATPAAVRFVSCEPLLGPIDLTKVACMTGCRPPDYCNFCHPDGGKATGKMDALQKGIGWVITGGESGQGTRPMNPQWARDIRDQCVSVNIPFFHKQNGEFASVSEVEGPGDHYSFGDGRTVRRVGKKRAGRLLDGQEWNEMPERGQS